MPAEPLPAARLLILGARSAQRPLYEAARRLGVQTLAADPDPHAPCFDQAQSHWVGDLGDFDGLTRFARAQGIDGVLTVAADFPMPALAHLAAALGLPGPSPEAVHRATYKPAMRAAFAQAGLPSPVSRLCRSAESAASAVRELGGLCILKPAQSSGGRGVTELDASADAAPLARAYAHAAPHTPDRCSVLVERCVQGPEFSVEGLVWGGRCEIVALTGKLTSGPPHHVELGHCQPPDLEAADREAIVKLARAAAAALGLDDCALHAEIRLSDQGPVLIECAARVGGGCIGTHLVPLSTGVDLLSAAIQVALGRRPDLTPRAPGGACAVRFMRAEPGVLLGFDGLEAARALPGVVEIECYLPAGARIGELTDATARCGHVLTHRPGALDRQALRQVIAQAEAARDAIQVRTR